MSLLDIAVSLASNSLTLFVGTGFSKHLTDGSAPSWTELLVECTKRIDTNDRLYNELFITDEQGNTRSKLDLTICAQILELEYQKQKYDIRLTICEILDDKINEKTINTEKISNLQDFFREYPSINIITTNYDTLLSKCVLPEVSRIIFEGSPIAMSNMGQNVYHVHGSTADPKSLVLTMNDYFRFQHSENFFSRKLFTLLQESTVVILGYSLGDFDLNRILNEAKNTKGRGLRKSNIYYVSRDEIDQLYKNYFLSTYGISVIENYEIDEFIKKISKLQSKAKSLILERTSSLIQIINGEKRYTDNFIKLGDSLDRVLLRAATIGINGNDEKFNRLLLKILKKKKKLTTQSGAWEQYAQLAAWLVEIGVVIQLSDSALKDEYLSLVKYSFKTMSRDQYLGFCWEAFAVWESRWDEIRMDNQELILFALKDEFFQAHTGVKELLSKFKLPEEQRYDSA